MATNLVLDVSNNDTITESALKASGAAALICKATEGTGFEDKTYEAMRLNAKHAGIPFGSYVFFHSSSQGGEAQYYLNYAKPKPGDIQPILDVEQGGQDTTVAALAKRATAAAQVLSDKGYNPILYSGAYYWKQLVAYSPKLKKLRVWEADYPGTYSRWFPLLAQKRVKLLSGASVVMWQWTDRLAVGVHFYDASRLFVPVNSLLIPANL